MKSVSLFISYSHRDESFRDELLAHLSPLRRSGLIQSWHDRCISPGAKWAEAIDQAIKQADIILPLISADFIASDYCYEKEMGIALERNENGEATVVPIVIRSVVWEHTPFADLQALPQGARPVEEWKFRDRGWADVARGVIEVSQGVFEQANQVHATARQTRSIVGLPQEAIAPADALDADENGGENLVEKWQDIASLFDSFPQLASRLAEHRRDKGTLEMLQQRAYKDSMAAAQSQLPIELTTFLVNGLRIEILKERIKVRLKEVEVLRELDEATRHDAVSDLRTQLAPQMLDLKVDSVSSSSQMLMSEIAEYADALRAAEKIAKLIRTTILEPLRGLAD